MGNMGEHLRRNWVEYLVLSGLAYFFLKNKKGKKIAEKILGKAKVWYKNNLGGA